jgi:hypothetical protein
MQSARVTPQAFTETKFARHPRAYNTNASDLVAVMDRMLVTVAQIALVVMTVAIVNHAVG